MCPAFFTRTTLLAIGVLAAACRDEGPAAVATVVVSSPIGNRLRLGRTVQLSAEPRDSRNGAVGMPVSWRSSAPSIASVGMTGSVNGSASGTAIISAEAGGVTGSVTLEVIPADFASMTGAINDPFLNALWQSLTAAARGRVLAAMGQCSTGITQGNFATIEACLAAARAEVVDATDPTDQALLGTAALFIDHVERLFNL